MSIVSSNIKYLRKLNGLTQEQFAQKLEIKRSLLGAYEEARANPNLTNLENMAAAFGVTVDNLLKNDLKKFSDKQELSLPFSASRQMTVSHSGTTQTRKPAYIEPQPATKTADPVQAHTPGPAMVSRPMNLKPASPETVQPDAAHTLENFPPPAPRSLHNNPFESGGTPQRHVFNNGYLSGETPFVLQAPYPTIPWVAKNQETDYVKKFQDPSYLVNLPSFQLPNLPNGYYRAFESGNDFMFAGALLVGDFVRNWYDIQKGGAYVFVLRNQGYIFRKVANQVSEKGTLTLCSDVASVPLMTVYLQEVLEVWEVKAFVSHQMPAPTPSIERLEKLVHEMQQEIKQVK